MKFLSAVWANFILLEDARCLCRAVRSFNLTTSWLADSSRGDRFTPKRSHVRIPAERLPWANAELPRVVVSELRRSTRGSGELRPCSMEILRISLIAATWERHYRSRSLSALITWFKPGLYPRGSRETAFWASSKETGFNKLTLRRYAGSSSCKRLHINQPSFCNCQHADECPFPDERLEVSLKLSDNAYPDTDTAAAPCLSSDSIPVSRLHE